MPLKENKAVPRGKLQKKVEPPTSFVNNYQKYVPKNMSDLTLENGPLVVSFLNCSSLSDNRVEKLVRLLIESINVDEPLPDIIALADTRITEYARLVGNGAYTLFSSSVGSQHGTGFLIHSRWKESIMQFKPLSNRLSYLDAKFGAINFRIIVVLLPDTSDRTMATCSLYQDILFRQIPSLIWGPRNSYIILGSFSAEIAAFRESDGEFGGDKEALINLNGYQRQRDWAGEQLINFCQEQRLYIVNRFTKIIKKRYTYNLTGKFKNKMEMDYILTPFKTSGDCFSIKHKMFRSGPDDNYNDKYFTTTHRLITAELPLGGFSNLCSQYPFTTHIMEISFVLEWAINSGQALICILFPKVISCEGISLILDKWSCELEGIRVGPCRYSFYTNYDNLLVFTPTEKEAVRIINDMNAISTKSLYITNTDCKLTGASLVDRIKFAELHLSLNEVDYRNESMQLIRRKWDCLLKQNFRIYTLIIDLLTYLEFQRPFTTQLLSRLYLVRARWLELVTDKNLWDTSFKICDMGTIEEAVSTKPVHPVYPYLGLLRFLERTTEETVYAVVLKFDDQEVLEKLRSDLSGRWLEERMIKPPSVGIYRNKKELLILLTNENHLDCGFDIASQYNNSIVTVTISDDSKIRELSSNLDDRLNCRRDNFMFKGKVLQLKECCCNVYCNMMLDLFLENEETIKAPSLISKKVELFVSLVQTTLIDKLILVPLNSNELAKLMEQECSLLRKLSIDININEVYKKCIIENFQAAYYRSKWIIASDPKCSKVLATFPNRSLWMSPLTWYGEQWKEIVKKEDRHKGPAWKLALAIYMTVNAPEVSLNVEDCNKPKIDDF